jgi:hypothetical protein
MNDYYPSTSGRGIPELSPYRSQSNSRREARSPAGRSIFTDQTSPLTHSGHSYFAAAAGSPPSTDPSHDYSKIKKDEIKATYHPSLTWRLDPDESLSDWTLTVVSNDSLGGHRTSDSGDSHSDDESLSASPRSSALNPSSVHATQKYFVHRTQLAVGPRRCEYFAKLFRSKKPKSLKRGATRIELRPSAARAFPQMLDFIYAPVGTPPDVTSETAVALRHLATCFGIRELFDYVTSFIKRDLSPETAPTYLLEAHTFQHEKLISVSLSVCAENFEAIKFSRMVALPPELFEKVVTSPDLQCSSQVLSARVASYCRCRPGMVDSDMLKRLTDSRLMPTIAEEESFFFLRLLVEMQSDEDSSCHPSSAVSGRTYDLYRRCVEQSSDIVRTAVAHQSETAGRATSANLSRQQRQLIKEYNSLPSTMKVDLLEHALCSDLAPPHDMTQVEHARIREEQAKLAIQKAKEAEAEMKQVCDMYESKLRTYESAMEEQEKELRAYAKELSRFRRVPNEHRIKPLLSEYTYQEEPEYDQYGETLYGQVPPSALPQFGKQSTDGWVFHQERWTEDGRHDDRCWPVYYYKGDS